MKWIFIHDQQMQPIGLKGWRAVLRRGLQCHNGLVLGFVRNTRRVRKLLRESGSSWRRPNSDMLEFCHWRWGLRYGPDQKQDECDG